MTTRPTVSPLFATDATFSAGAESGLAPRLDPGAGFRGQGWYANTRFASRHFNFLRGLIGDWVSYLDQKTGHAQNVLNFGADPLGASDSTTAIANANTAASSADGYVWFPGGSFRCDDSLHPSPGVSWKGVPDGTFLNINHATKSQLIFDNGSSRKGFTEFSGIGFGALVDNTGDAVVVSNNLKLKFSNCTWNDPGSGGSPKLKGRFLNGGGAGTIVAFEDCWMKALGTVTALLLSSTGGELRLSGTDLFMPATYTGPLIDIDDGIIKAFENTFDVTAHGGSSDIIELLSLGYHVLRGNTFKGAFSSGSCITAFGGTKLSETDSVFDTVNAYNITGGALALGSELTLQSPIATTISGTGTVTCATGYRGQSFKFTSTSFGATGPLIVMPGILFINQRFTLTVFNAGDDSWTSGFSISGAVIPLPSQLTLSNISANVRTLSFVALDVNADGTPFWVVESDPTSPYAAT